LCATGGAMQGRREPICRHIGATEDAAARRLAHVGRAGHFLDRPLTPDTDVSVACEPTHHAMTASLDRVGGQPPPRGKTARSRRTTPMIATAEGKSTTIGPAVLPNAM
jgi:hypothetical protein